MGDKIQSKYIKEKIKGKKFNNRKHREYIDTLVFLERSITKGIHGWAGNVQLFWVKENHPDHYEALLKELKPKRYKEYIREKKKEALEEQRERKRWKEREKQELEEEKKWWVENGGILTKFI